MNLCVKYPISKSVGTTTIDFRSVSIVIWNYYTHTHRLYTPLNLMFIDWACWNSLSLYREHHPGWMYFFPSFFDGYQIQKASYPRVPSFHPSTRMRTSSASFPGVVFIKITGDGISPIVRFDSFFARWYSSSYGLYGLFDLAWLEWLRCPVVPLVLRSVLMFFVYKITNFLPNRALWFVFCISCKVLSWFL